MRKQLIIVLLIVAIILLALFENFLFRIIGFVSLVALNVNIEEKISGKILLVFEPWLEIGRNQEIYAEFINTGTKPVTAKIELRIYGYLNGTSKPLAYYYDASVLLNPGMRRNFKTLFVPPHIGLYYIQARASYDTRVVETWGAFVVHYPVQPILVYAPPPALPKPGVPKISLEYPKKIKLLVNESILFSITAKNIGEVDLHNLKLFVSTSSLISFSVNPKQFGVLSPNESVVFLISVYAPPNITEGLYPFEFELVSDEIKERGKTMIEVSSLPVPEEEDIREKILNYELLIFEINSQIFSAFLKGFDVSLANESLKSAKKSLEFAKYHFRLKNFKEAKIELENTRKFLEDAVFQLASSTLYIYKPPAFLPLLIILIPILILTTTILAYYYTKKKRRRPKLLGEVIEEEK